MLKVKHAHKSDTEDTNIIERSEKTARRKKIRCYIPIFEDCIEHNGYIGRKVVRTIEVSPLYIRPH